MRRTHAVAIILVLVFIVGCGPRGIRYTATLSNLGCTANRSVAVAVLDERPYVLSKEKDPSYVGVMRGGYGNPFSMWTESGAPLSDDMLTTITDSLRARGFSAVPLKTSTADSPNSVMARFNAAGADRLILMRVKEWQSDYLPKAFTAERSSLFLDVSVVIFNRAQKSIESTNLREELTLPSGWPVDTVPDVYQSKMRQLIDDPRVCRALR
jgi:hypothetical protein